MKEFDPNGTRTVGVLTKVNLYMYIYIIYIYIYICVCVCVCVIHIYINIYIYISTYISEADPALELVKEFDPNGTRTLASCTR